MLQNNLKSSIYSLASCLETYLSDSVIKFDEFKLFVLFLIVFSTIYLDDRF